MKYEKVHSIYKRFITDTEIDPTLVSLTPSWHDFSIIYLETEYRLFPPVTIFLNLFPRAGYFFNAFD